VQTLPQLLPLAEIGTAQQEIPVAQFKATSFEVSLTRREVCVLAEGLEALRRQYDEGPVCDGQDPWTLGKLLEEFKKITD